jgi:hypothetical protein
MTDKKKGEAEKTGKFFGGGVKQGWSAIKRFGKGVKESVSEKKK